MARPNKNRKQSRSSGPLNNNTAPRANSAEGSVVTKGETSQTMAAAPGPGGSIPNSTGPSGIKPNNRSAGPTTDAGRSTCTSNTTYNNTTTTTTSPTTNDATTTTKNGNKKENSLWARQDAATRRAEKEQGWFLHGQHNADSNRVTRHIDVEARGRYTTPAKQGRMDGASFWEFLEDERWKLEAWPAHTIWKGMSERDRQRIEDFVGEADEDEDGVYSDDDF